MKIQHITALLLSCVLLLASCGGGETDTDMSEDTTVDTQTEETVDAEETEPKKTEEETKKQQAGYTDFQKLTVSEADAPYFDAAASMFVVRFTDANVHYRADDPCAIGISGDGEAYSVTGTIDLGAFPEFADGDFFTGVAVKPSEELYEGTYTITITFGEYMVSFPCTIG